LVELCNLSGNNHSLTSALYIISSIQKTFEVGTKRWALFFTNYITENIVGVPNNFYIYKKYFKDIPQSRVSKQQPAGQILSTKPFHSACEAIYIWVQRHFANNEKLIISKT